MRVAVGDFGIIHRLGFEYLIALPDFEFVGDGLEDQPIRERVKRDKPDVLLMDVDAPDAVAETAALRAEFPDLMVLGCGAARPILRIYPKDQNRNPYDIPLDRDRLLKAIGSTASLGK